jgi:small subunit ribosomal protein S6
MPGGRAAGLNTRGENDMADIQSLADAPGSSREYETIFILAPETPNDGVAQLNDRIKGVVEGLGGKVLKVDNWGKRKLAYEVKKHLKGIYLYWQYLGTRGLVDELERNLRMLDPVIRYRTVRVDENIDPAARPTEMDDEAYARAADTAADEEDLVMGTAGDQAAGDVAEAAAGDEAEAESKGSTEGDEAVAGEAGGETQDKED